MSNNFLGLPLWVWLVVIAMIAYNCYLTTNNMCGISSNSVKTTTIPTKTNECFNNNTIIQFFGASWCRWTQKFKLEWDELKLSNIDKNCGYTLLEYDDSNSQDIMKEYNITGFPTIIINDKKYEGPRTAEAIIAYLQQ